MTEEKSPLVVLTVASPLQVAVDIFHADADLLQNVVPDPPFASQAVYGHPVLILFLVEVSHCRHLMLVANVANVDDLRAVVLRVRP